MRHASVEIRLVERGAAEICTREVGLLEHRHLEVGVGEIGLEELGVGEIGLAEVDTREVHLAQVLAGELRLLARVLAAPLVPGLHTLVQDVDMRSIRHVPPSLKHILYTAREPSVRQYERSWHHGEMENEGSHFRGVRATTEGRAGGRSGRQ